MDRKLKLAAQYICALEHGLDSTSNAGERPAYEGHLARAARIASALILEEMSIARAQINTVRRAHASGYLDGPRGSAAEAAFLKLAASIESDGRDARPA